MKRARKLLPIMLTIAMGITATFALAACDENYTTTETDNLIAELLTTLQNTDATQDEKIAELVSKITALEEATRITDVQFSDNGDLIITFGDGSTQTVKAPEKHVHTVGEWTVFTDNDTPCEERLFFRVCEDCHSVEWKQGEYSDHDFTIVTTAPTCTAQGYDTKTCEICGKVEIVNYTPVVPHPWATEYSEDNSYHWYDCTTCNAVKGKEEHTDDGSGNCSVCDYPIGPTAGIVYDVVDGKARVITYEGTATRVRIAETYRGAPVTEIANSAFRNCDSLTSVVIPDSVTSIGDCAFYDCSSLTNITIPDSVTSIGGEAFRQCYSLTSVVIPDSVTSIGSSTFDNCDSLTSVVIPDSVTSIGSWAFRQCDSLTSVVIPDSVTSIGGAAFYGCRSLTSITIPDSVTSIGEYAFEGCNNLISEYNYVQYLKANSNPYFVVLRVTNKNFSTYTIHPNAKIIASSAFEDCDSLTSVVIPDSVTSIGNSAFKYCSSLTSVEIGDSVTSIGSEAFYDCHSLTSVVIPDSVTSIGSEAFNDCNSLTSVVIPDSVTSIGFEAFYDCDSLTSVYITDIAAWCNISFGRSSANPLYYAKNLYLNNELVTELVIPDSVTSIGNYAFRNCDSLTSVVIGDNVTSIGFEAFYDCDSLTSVEIGDSVTSIGGYAFDGCSSLTSVVIGDSVTLIGNSAFEGCSSLTSVVIGDSVTLIGNSAFSGCNSLTSVTFKDTSTWYRTDSYDQWENKTGGTQISVTTPSANATYFKDFNWYYYWYKL